MLDRKTAHNLAVDVYNEVLSGAPTGGTERERRAWLNGLTEALEEVFFQLTGEAWVEEDEYGIEG